MTLTGKTLWLALGAAFVLGAIPGVLFGTTRKGSVEVVTVAADAGVAVAIDAGVHSTADCELTITSWQKVPLFTVTPGDAGVAVASSGPTQFVYIPDVRLSGHSESVATQQVEAKAEAASSATVTKASDAPYLVLGAGLGVQHDVEYVPTVNGRIGVGWARQAVTLSGGVDPFSSQHWNAQVGWELHW